MFTVNPSHSDVNGSEGSQRIVSALELSSSNYSTFSKLEYSPTKEYPDKTNI